MRTVAALLVGALIMAVAIPAGSQGGAVVVKPRVLVRADGRPPEPADVPRSFGVNLVVKFWIEESDKETFSVELRCATPKYHVSLTDDSGEFEQRVEISGGIVLLRDRAILLSFDTALGKTGQGLRSAVAFKGSVILREGEDKVLFKTGEMSLHATFTIEEANQR